LAAVALGVINGARVVRVHDVGGSVRVCRTVEAILEARWNRVASGAGSPERR
jgi:dihydropteroate synthase